MWKRLLFRQGCRFTDEGIFVPMCLSKPLRGAKMLKGCNMSFPKEAILSINGFNEDYKLPSIGEDEDIDWRLRAMGYQFVSVRNRAIVYHLHHKSNWDSNDRNKNLVIMVGEKISDRFICYNGINNHI
jgi:GT2 family glycosyltransferase